jgi:vacuolar-type H+-ATPase subunit E/Vma4
LSIQALEAEIERKAEQEASSIRATAEAEAQKIVDEAAAKGAGLRDERLKALQREINAQEKAELAVARMGRKGDLLRVKSKWAERVIEEAEKRITKMADSGGQEYHELLANLTIDGITKMNGNKFTVEVTPRDNGAISSLLETITARASKLKDDKVAIQLGTLKTKSLGGVVVSTEDGVQYFNNTLEARLSAASRQLEATIHEILFPAGETNE